MWLEAQHYTRFNFRFILHKHSHKSSNPQPLAYHTPLPPHHSHSWTYMMLSIFINRYKSCNQYFNSQTILNGETLNYKVLYLVKHYNLDIGYVPIQGHLKIFKIYISKSEKRRALTIHENCESSSTPHLLLGAGVWTSVKGHHIHLRSVQLVLVNK
jgi:hypothetical protein